MAGIKDKLSVEKIKSLGLKHGEKLVLGLVGVFVLMSLVGTQWATYKKVPSELTVNLDAADKVIEGAQWTQEEQDKYPDYSPKTIVQTMLSNMSSSPY
ncbi:MAG: hypothetical protein JKY95_19490, partial [Planctomycetaceae bacterium]|nr:hypothetical protein [Planctomycetaceae bacterium]